MPPSRPMPIPALWYEKRQDAASIPTCVTSCLASGSVGNCTSNTDYACLCESTVYSNSVGACWEASCNATEITIGQNYSAQACASFGINVSSTAAPSSAIWTAVASTTASSDGVVSTSHAPNTLHPTFVNVQAIMSSICSALVALALVLGIMSCRSRARRNRETTQNRTWTGVGNSTFGATSINPDKPSKSRKFGFSRAQSSAFTNSRNQTSTFASDNYGLTSSNFGGSSQFQGRGQGQSLGVGIRGDRGFSNRLTLEEGIGEGEEWEMAMTPRKEDGHGEGELELESPGTSRIGIGERDVGSEVRLNRPRELGEAI